MLQRPTLLPSSARTSTRLIDTTNLPVGTSSEAMDARSHLSTFCDDEVVIVEPTDPDEDRILQEELNRVTNTTPFSTSIVINRSRSVNHSLSNQPNSAVGRSTIHSVETVPVVQLVESPKSIGNMSVNDALQSLLSTTARMNQFQSISIQPLLTSSVNTSPNSTNQNLPTSHPTLWVPTSHATTTVPTSSSTNSVTSSFEDITKLAQHLAPLNPLIAAVLVNCATVNLISQLAGSLVTPVYNVGAFTSSNISQNGTAILSNLLSTLLPNFNTNVQSSEISELNNVIANSHEAKQLERCAAIPPSTNTVLSPHVRASTPTSLTTLTSTETSGRTTVRVKRFKCPVPSCTMAFYSRFNLAEHVRTHTGERPFTCPDSDCQAAFKRRRDLRDHWNTHLSRISNSTMLVDSDSKTDAAIQNKIAVDCNSAPECSATPKTLPTTVSLTPSVADDVKVKVEEKTELINDTDTDCLQTDEQSIIGRYRCPFLGCEKSYARRHRLNQHVSWHTGTKPFQCDEPNCRIRYYSERDLRRHKLAHLSASDRSNLRRHACSYPNCGKAYSKMNKLKEHVRSHTGERPYVCREPGCGAAFIRLYGVRRHELTHLFGRRRDKHPASFHTSVSDTTNETRTESPSTPMEPIRVEQPPPNVMTDAVSSILASLGLKNSGTGEATSDITAASTPRTLPAIAPKTNTLVSLRPLSPISGPPGMRRPHVCPYKDCGKAFPKLNKLREHVCRHTGERPYACDKCTASFVRMYDLRRHGNIHLRGGQPRSNHRTLAPRPREYRREATSLHSPPMEPETETVPVN